MPLGVLPAGPASPADTPALPATPERGQVRRAESAQDPFKPESFAFSEAVLRAQGCRLRKQDHTARSDLPSSFSVKPPASLLPTEPRPWDVSADSQVSYGSL